MRGFGWLFAVLTVLTLQGCISAKPIRTFTEAEPIRVSDTPKTIAVTRVVTSMPKGAVLGAVQGGLACAGQQRLEWAQVGQLAIGAEQRYTDRIRDEFKAAGYRVAPTPSEDASGLALFQDPQSAADFLVAAVIKDIAWNLCYPFAGFGNVNSSSGEASIEIEWHLYDPEAKSILFKTTTGGTGKSDTQTRGGQEALYSAVGMATRNLLAEQELSFYLTSGLKGKSPGVTPARVTTDQKTPPPVPSAPKSAESVPSASPPVAAAAGPPPPPALGIERQLDQIDELKAKGRITPDEHGALRRRVIETGPLDPIAAPKTASSSPAVEAKPAPPPLAGRWRTEGAEGRLEITETTIGQFSWEYEGTDRAYAYRMRGTGYLDGDRLELTGTYTSGDAYSVNKPFIFSLRREGPLLVGSFTGSLNRPRPLRFSKEP